MRAILLTALLIALPLPALAEVPARAFPSAKDTGPLREQPQALSHWQKMADDMASQAAPRLKASRVAVSSRAYGQASVFDLAFHDFFVAALYRQGVAVTANNYGARVEIDTFPVGFSNWRRTTRVHQTERSAERYASAAPNELALSVRIFDGGDLVFAGSTTYYLPRQDLEKYEALWAPSALGYRVDGDFYNTGVSGRYGTRTWGCQPELQSHCN